jgi:dual specificity tyrosine-phosphorylation-regulated kinase 2/3/4
MTLYQFIHSSSSSSEIRRIVSPKLIKPIVTRREDHVVPTTHLAFPKHALHIDSYQQIATTLVSCLHLLHKEGIIHGDIKPENVFLSWDEHLSIDPSTVSKLEHLPPKFILKLGDFSSSFHKSEINFDDAAMDYEIQSLPYRAPEVLCGCPFGHHIDTWSVGIILLEVAIGKTLFTSSTKEDIWFEIGKLLCHPSHTRFLGGKYYSLLQHSCKSNELSYYEYIHKMQVFISSRLDKVPKYLVQFLVELLHPNPDERIISIKALQHPFISSSISIPITSIVSLSTSGSSSNDFATLKSMKDRASKLRSHTKAFIEKQHITTV